MRSPPHDSALVILGYFRVAISQSKHTCMERKERIMDTSETGLLTPLFEARLQYQSDMKVVVSAETREGELVGSGDGTVTGASLSGKVRWSMYAGNCAYVFVRAGLLPPPGQHLCTVHPAGIIATDDGAEIWFDAKGYGGRLFALRPVSGTAAGCSTSVHAADRWSASSSASSAWTVHPLASCCWECFLCHLWSRVAPPGRRRRSDG